MINGMSYPQWKELMDRSKFATAQDDSSGTNYFSSDVPEDRVRFLIGFIFNDTSGAANTFDLSKVEEDNTTTTMIPNFNLSGNETVVVSIYDLGLVAPSLEGATNLELNANSDGVDSTVFYFDNEV